MKDETFLFGTPAFNTRSRRKLNQSNSLSNADDSTMLNSSTDDRRFEAKGVVRTLIDQSIINDHEIVAHRTDATNSNSQYLEFTTPVGLSCTERIEEVATPIENYILSHILPDDIAFADETPAHHATKVGAKTCDVIGTDIGRKISASNASKLKNTPFRKFVATPKEVDTNGSTGMATKIAVIKSGGKKKQTRSSDHDSPSAVSVTPSLNETFTYQPEESRSRTTEGTTSTGVSEVVNEKMFDNQRIVKNQKSPNCSMSQTLMDGSVSKLKATESALNSANKKANVPGDKCENKLSSKLRCCSMSEALHEAGDVCRKKSSASNASKLKNIPFGKPIATSLKVGADRSIVRATKTVVSKSDGKKKQTGSSGHDSPSAVSVTPSLNEAFTYQPEESRSRTAEGTTSTTVSEVVSEQMLNNHRSVKNQKSPNCLMNQALTDGSVSKLKATESAVKSMNKKANVLGDKCENKLTSTLGCCFMPEVLHEACSEMGDQKSEIKVRMRRTSMLNGAKKIQGKNVANTRIETANTKTDAYGMTEMASVLKRNVEGTVGTVKTDTTPATLSEIECRSATLPNFTIGTVAEESQSDGEVEKLEFSDKLFTSTPRISSFSGANVERCTLVADDKAAIPSELLSTYGKEVVEGGNVQPMLSETPAVNRAINSEMPRSVTKPEVTSFFPLKVSPSYPTKLQLFLANLKNIKDRVTQPDASKDVPKTYQMDMDFAFRAVGKQHVGVRMSTIVDRISAIGEPVAVSKTATKKVDKKVGVKKKQIRAKKMAMGKRMRAKHNWKNKHNDVDYLQDEKILSEVILPVVDNKMRLKRLPVYKENRAFILRREAVIGQKKMASKI